MTVLHDWEGWERTTARSCPLILYFDKLGATTSGQRSRFSINYFELNILFSINCKKCTASIFLSKVIFKKNFKKNIKKFAGIKNGCIFAPAFENSY